MLYLLYMNKSLVFAIKANVAIVIAGFLLSLLVSFPVALIFEDSGSSFLLWVLLSLIVTMGSVYLSVSTLIQNTKFKDSERAEALRATQTIYVIVSLFFICLSVLFPGKAQQFGLMALIPLYIAQLLLALYMIQLAGRK